MKTLASLIAAVAALSLSTAVAQPTRIPVDGTRTIPVRCCPTCAPVPILVEISGTVIRHADGRSMGADTKQTWTNPANGKQFVLMTSGWSLVTIDLDPVAGTVTQTISTAGSRRVIIPGQGAVLVDAGNTVTTIVRDLATNAVLDMDVVSSGRDDAGLVINQSSLVCQYLLD